MSWMDSAAWIVSSSLTLPLTFAPFAAVIERSTVLFAIYQFTGVFVCVSNPRNILQIQFA